MRYVIRTLCLLAPLQLIQACGRDAGPLEQVVSPQDPQPKDDTGGIGNLGVNQCPVASSQILSVATGSTVSFQLMAMDPDGDPLQFMVTQPPAHGTVSVTDNMGAATYAPAPGYTGPDSFKFKAADSECQSLEGTVFLTVGLVDSDGDGVLDGDDDCPESDLGTTVLVGACDTGVPNLIDGATANSNGCSLADLVHGLLTEAAAGATNHGQFVSAMSKSLKNLAGIGLIGANQREDIMECVAQVDESDFQR